MISPLHQRWLESRRIDLEIAARMGLYSGERDSNGQVEPTNKGNVLVFPYLRDGAEVGAKYRGPKKVFWQKAAARKQFWNADVLSDPALIDGSEALLIVEGEMDALAVLTAGYPFVVSVPEGAMPARDANGELIYVPESTDDIDVKNDFKFAFLRADWGRLSKVKRIVIGTDADEPGQRLAAELVRRLDRIRCSFITMPEGVKDWNELLVRDGPDAIRGVLRACKPYPISGVYHASDLPAEPPIRPMATGWEVVDKILRPYAGAFMVVSGFPGHGKSTWTTQLAAQMAGIHDWTVAIASYEMRIKPYLTDSIRSVYLQRRVETASEAEKRKSQDFVERNFVFISPPVMDSEAEPDIDWLLDRMETAVIRDGARMVVIDPFNEIEHKRRKDESMTEYIGRAIRKLKSFAMQYDVLVVVVVHPTKASAQIEPENLTLYSIADSSHWANKADLGVIVGRIGTSPLDSLTGIYVKKIRYQPEAGELSSAILTFDRQLRIFI
jgi:twinkle protein